jgi:hypothetical protein
LLDEACQDMENFALLIESWERLGTASSAVSIAQPAR